MRPGGGVCGVIKGGVKLLVGIRLEAKRICDGDVEFYQSLF